MIAALALALALTAGPAAPSDYAAELAGIDRRLEDVQAAERVYWLYTRASLTGDLDDWAAVWHLVGERLKTSPSAESLLYQATVALELHKLDDAEAALDDLGQAFPEFADANPSYPRLLRADIALQRGRYDEAKRTYDALLAEDRTWDRLARVAYHERRSGRHRRADELYAEAQEPLSVKEMRRWAWLELQRGLVDLDRAKYDHALKHFQRADRAYSGYWLIEEHMAEALVALGRFVNAESIYRRVAKATENPEYLAALADLISGSDPVEAEALQQRALHGFEQRFERFPEAVAGHFADYLLAHDVDHPGLLELAELDHRLRPNVDTTARLADVHRELRRIHLVKTH